MSASSERPRRDPEEILAGVQVRWTPEADARVRSSIQARIATPDLPRAHRRARRVLAGAAFAICLAAAFGLGRLWGRRAPETVLSDGSTIQSVIADSVFEVKRMTPSEVLVHLERGGVRVHVRPNRQRVFRVRSGALEVRVLGTRFSMRRLGTKTRVAVEEGRVLASVGTATSVLGAGESGVFPPPATQGSRSEEPRADVGAGARLPDSRTTSSSGSAVLGPPPGRPRLDETKPSHEAEAPERVPVARRKTAPPDRREGGHSGAALASDRKGHAVRSPRLKSRSHPESGARAWRRTADAGDFEAAAGQLGDEGELRSVEDLMLASDVLRLTGRHHRALRLLRRVERDYPSDPRAPLACFTAGRILLDDLGRPREAAEAFRRVREAHRAFGLSEDALAREVEAWWRAGERIRARDLAEIYVRRYPNGYRRSRVETYGELESER